MSTHNVLDQVKRAADAQPADSDGIHWTIYLGNDVWLGWKAGAPTDSTGGAGKAGTGSKVVNTSSGLSYSNIGTITTPDWERDSLPSTP